MAAVLQKLKDEGWFLSEDGLKKLNENGLIGDVKELTKRALAHDLRELVTNGGLPNDIAKSSKAELPPSGVVLQVINVRNVSAPKVNQESKTSPRLLQIDLTDGQTLCSGLDLEHLSAFNINVAPGTKVLLRNSVKILQGFLLLTPQNLSLLGGQVLALFEKWEAKRTLDKYAGIGGPSSKKSTADALKGSPPPWISFGNKVQGANDDEASLKSQSTISKTKEVSKEEMEFIALRNSAIAEAATKGEVKKQFGGNIRQLMDHNVKKILSKGYTEEQANQALKLARNNLERAMGNLKKRNGNNEITDKRFKQHEPSAPSFRRNGKSDEPPPAKPSGKVSLFDFFSDKIPDVEPPHKTNTRMPNSQSTLKNETNDYGSGSKAQNSQRNVTKFENNISSSFASRQKKDESQPRSKWNDKNATEKGNKPTFQQYQSSQQQQQPQQQQQQQHQYQSSHKASQINTQVYQNPNPNYQQNSRYMASSNNAPSSDTQYNDLNNRRPQNDRKVLPKANASSNIKPKPNMRGLIDATTNLQISDGKQKQHKTNQQQPPLSQQQQQQQQQRNANFEEMFPQAKRFPYNPYKIMGFQNKETNEFAMNVLKMGDQNKSNVGNNTSGGGGGGGGGGSGNFVNNNRNSSAAASSQSNVKPVQMPNQQISIVPVPSNIPTQKPNYINPNVQAYNLPAISQPAQSFSWSFKVGDRCLAKYWEDEKYYNAEIQAVTEKTCVVHYPEYGNIEEVLHADCLPITDSNHQPINQYNAQAPAPVHPISYTQLASNKAGPPPSHFHQTFHAQDGPQPPPHHSAVLHAQIPAQPNQQHQRYRGNRPVYVPPAQRK